MEKLNGPMWWCKHEEVTVGEVNGWDAIHPQFGQSLYKSTGGWHHKYKRHANYVVLYTIFLYLQNCWGWVVFLCHRNINTVSNKTDVLKQNYWIWGSPPPWALHSYTYPNYRVSQFFFTLPLKMTDHIILSKLYSIHICFFCTGL